MTLKPAYGWLAVCAAIVVLARVTSHAQATPVATAERDGSHDFDFERGYWHIHLKRLLNPLTGSKTWEEFDGTSSTRQFWNGASQIEEFETVTASGKPIEGLTLRTYNPASHQWRLYWANSRNGVLVPPQIGQFKDGQGEFYAQDTLNGKSIFIRFIWSKTNTDKPHFEQSFSDDGGKTWEVNWITDQTRLPEQAKSDVRPASAESEDQHSFDFLFGTKRYHLKRLEHPLTGSTSWVEGDGTSTGYQIWGGRADLTETKADGSGGSLMGMTLRTYNPDTHQWYLYWANSRDGIVSVPQVGQFGKGVGEFLATDTYNGRGILVRYVWTGSNTNAPQFEQSYSDDGGKTWEVNWISSVDVSTGH